jgi:outer membrane protein OmpA-like peptidoglycan-associated protein
MKRLFIYVLFLYIQLSTVLSQKGDPLPIWLNGKVDCDITSYYIDKLGKKHQPCERRVKVVVKKERLIRPLLNQVYFEENTALLDTSIYNMFKNSQESQSFDEESTLSFLVKNHNNGEQRILAYRYVLDIIAKRFLRVIENDRQADAKIQHYLYLYGYSTINEIKQHQSDTLSKQRAQTVADYFKKVWGIEENYIKTLVGDSPKIKRKSLPEDSLKIDQENRTVLILTDPIEERKVIKFNPGTDDSHPLAFIYTDENKTQNLSIEGYANHFRFAPNIDNSLKDSIRTIDLMVIFNSDTILIENDIDMDMIGANKNIPADSIRQPTYKKFTWKFDFDDETKYPLNDANINWIIIVNDKNGKQYYIRSDTYEVIVEVDDKSERRVRNDPKTGKKVNVYTYWMQLFDFGEESLRSIDKEQIMTVCNQKQLNLSKNTEITITGFADKIGTNKYNLELSQKRAKETKNEIESILKKKGIKDLPKIEYIGEGSDNDLQTDNSTPQGRAYSRTVQIEVTLPLLGR